MILFFAIVLSILSSEITASKYAGCRVYEVLPEKPMHAQVLELLHCTSDFDFWTRSRVLNKPAVIMVTPILMDRFKEIMKKGKFKHKEIISDVQKLFEDKLCPRCAKPLSANGSISINSYNSYKVIKNYLLTLQQNSHKAQTFSIGRTIDGRDIWAVKVSINDHKKPAILVDAGIHAREWISPATALYLINQLVEYCANEEMLKAVDWYIVPLLNPDGYEYSRRVDRLWRKNRSKGKVCMGVDANRNFDYHWMDGGSSADECSETFAGKRPFSERETVALRDFVFKHRDTIKLYITLHSFGSFILYPWNYSPYPPENENDLRELAKNVSEAIEAVHGTHYIYGNSNRVLYRASGNSEDWMKAVAGIQLSFAMELPGGGHTGFDVPANKIETVGKETFEGFKVFWSHVSKKWSKDFKKGQDECLRDD